MLTADRASCRRHPAQLARVKVGRLLAAVVAALSRWPSRSSLAGHPERLGRLALRIERVLPARLARIVAGFVETFTQGLAVMRQPRRLLVSLALSFPLWLSIAAGIWLTSLAFHITFPYRGSFLVMTILVVGVAVPTPGRGRRVSRGLQIAVQTFFGVPDDRAVGAAIVLHAISFVPVTAARRRCSWRARLTLAGAKRSVGSSSRRRRAARRRQRLRAAR